MEARLTHPTLMLQRIAFLALTLFLPGATLAVDEPRGVAIQSNDLWQRTLSLVTGGQFDEADSLLERVESKAPTTEQIRSWLNEWQEIDAIRREANRRDLETYITYAKERIVRREYDAALGWLFRAKDVAERPDDLLVEPWVQKLVNDALADADTMRKEDRWRAAWEIYSALASVFDLEPRYQKLEHEAVNHLRLEAMFRRDSQWHERIERVEWRDAKAALEFVEAYYVEPPDFKVITEGGLEQLLLLADSRSAQDRFEGLRNVRDRADFKARVQQHLDQVRATPMLSRRECIRRFSRAVETINEQTVRLPENVIVSELMRGALDPLDEFTTMIWPQETEDFEKHTRGDFIGVGISIIKNATDEIEVVTPLEDTPAYRAGIQAGDIITHADGESLAGKSTNKVVDVITGPKDTMVTLTVRRGQKELTFPLKRAKVKIQSVKGWERDDNELWDFWRDRENGIGYVRLTNFQRNTPEDLKNVLSELQARGMKGLILDLRGNPGGLLDSAWQISTLFLNRNDVVVSTRGRVPDDDQNLRALSDGAYAGLPLVVLVDQSSASASEIVSGAVRDNGTGKVIGERTFGKFSVQNLIPLPRSRAKLKITTASYFLPSGVSLHREPGSESWGVEPNIPIPLSRKERIKIFQMRRKADLIGPQKEDVLADDDLVHDGLDEGVDGEENDEAEVAHLRLPWSIRTLTEKEQKARDLGTVVDWTEVSGLPGLAQPDENKRPDIDPQVDAALLVLRVKLLGDQYPTLATAERDPASKTANP